MSPNAIQRAQSIVLLLCMMTFAQSGRAQFVEISADIELVSYDAGRTNTDVTPKPRIISVVCITGTNSWRIENDATMNGVNKWFFDGTNVYETVQITRPLPKETQDRMNSSRGLLATSFEPTPSNLTINIWSSRDGHPLGDKGENIPWLAFCSGTYLQRQGRLIPLTCEILRHTPDRYAYSDRTGTFSDSFGLPYSVDLFFSRSLYLASVEDFYKGWGSRYLDAMKSAVTNLDDGTLMFHYLVTASTNFQSWTFPLRFEFFQNARAFIQNGNWFTRGTGTVKSIRAAAAPTNVFDPRMHQTIVDWRFHDDATGVDANMYTWTNSFTPQVDDPVLRDIFKKRVEKLRRPKEAVR